MYPSAKKTCQVSIWKSVEFMRLRTTNHSIFSFYICTTNLVLLKTTKPQKFVLLRLVSRFAFQLLTLYIVTDNILQQSEPDRDDGRNDTLVSYIIEKYYTSSWSLAARLRYQTYTKQSCFHVKHSETTRQSQDNFTCSYLTNWCLFFVKSSELY